jgi:hypothetical protein
MNYAIEIEVRCHDLHTEFLKNGSGVRKLIGDDTRTNRQIHTVTGR